MVHTMKTIPLRLVFINAVAMFVTAWSSLAFCREARYLNWTTDLEEVKGRLKADHQSVFSKDDCGRTLLHYASLESRKDVVEFLVANQAEVSVKDIRRSCPGPRGGAFVASAETIPQQSQWRPASGDF